jgi:hypothetical protein
MIKRTMETIAAFTSQQKMGLFEDPAEDLSRKAAGDGISDHYPGQPFVLGHAVGCICDDRLGGKRGARTKDHIGYGHFTEVGVGLADDRRIPDRLRLVLPTRTL